jgi:acetoacetyl-[acyl-carrier protein] synthase
MTKTKKPLAVITSIGGINASGRTSSFQGYKNIVFDSLDATKQLETIQDLAVLQGKIEPISKGWETSAGDAITLKDYLLANVDLIRSETMIRKIDREIYDPDGIILDSIKASAAGQLPSGFDPSSFYPARQHPKALQMTVFGMSDALNQLGIDWGKIQEQICPSEVAVFSGAAIGQMDKFGFAGMMQSRIKGSRSSSKNLPLGLVEMSADFINAYILGSVGRSGHCVGACATFLYNLQMGKEAIESGSSRFVIVGGAEAPITPEVVDGFYAMNALADDKKMMELQAQLNESVDNGPDHLKACRPFGLNAGMILGESAQFIILMDDKLALDLGANIYGSVPEVKSYADGFKSSISGPGVGNYITMAKAVSKAEKILGLKNLKNHTFVQAHGTGTPANRTTESHIFSKIAEAYKISSWPVSAIKSYLGHSMAPASGDQMVAALGTWKEGIIPGIHGVNETAPDVHTKNLNFLVEHKCEEVNYYKAAFLNAKGFGGNNASALILSPFETLKILNEKHGKNKVSLYNKKNISTEKKVYDYNQKALKGDYKITYKFNENVLQGEKDVSISKKEIKLKGYKNSIKL